MGKSDGLIIPTYKALLKPVPAVTWDIKNEGFRQERVPGTTALLGFSECSWVGGDCYDLSLKNWNINSEWELDKKYDRIISTRCPYFCKDPEDFVDRVYASLKPGGTFLLDWGLGDHWRFDDYKVGWVKNGEHEFAYENDNHLWSTVWDDSFLVDDNFVTFQNNVKKFGYTDVKKAIQEEVPKILPLKYFERYFTFQTQLRALWDGRPQLYIMVFGVK